MQITVADISRWQGNINFDEFCKHVDAVIIKATGSDGGLYTDGKLKTNQQGFRSRSKPVWYYHYKGSGTPQEQAQYFLSAIGGLQPGEAVVLDDENETKVNVTFDGAFADEIKKLTGLNNVVYSNLSRFQNVNLQALKDRNLGAWVAKYGANDGTIGGAGAAPAGLDVAIIMWQYTSRAVIPGCPDNTVDVSLFYGSLDQFKAYGAPNNVPAPQPAPATAPQPTPATGDGYYTVVSGDTLSGIGNKLGQNWQVIAATNGIFAPYTIYPGQRLKVYGGAPNLPVASSKTYTVVSGDNLSAIGVKTGVAWQTIAELNGIRSPYTIYPGQVLKLGGSADVKTPTYTVVRGDYLSLIGQKTGIDWHQIARVNGIGEPYTIYPGQVLKLA